MAKKSKGFQGPDMFNPYTAPCYTTHPPLPLGEHKIWGGNCATPVVSDADIYLGLDESMARHESLLPWSRADGYLFLIPDMGVPGIKDFRKLLAWLEEELQDGAKIHVGCIGGHGRTGLVFAALVKELLGEADAIAYVRANYCPKAVETQEQVDFLCQHFDILPAPPSHGPAALWSVPPATKPVPVQEEIPPLESSMDIWSRKKPL